MRFLIPTFLACILCTSQGLAQSPVSVYDEIRVDNYVRFHLDHPDHLTELNATRAAAGVAPLTRSEGLDWIAEKRGIRMAELLINDMENAHLIFAPNCPPSFSEIFDSELAHFHPHYDFMFMENFLLLPGLILRPVIGHERDEATKFTLPVYGSMMDIDLEDYFADPAGIGACRFVNNCDSLYFMGSNPATHQKLNRRKSDYGIRTDHEHTEVGFAYTTIIIQVPGYCMFDTYEPTPMEKSFTFFYEVFN